MIKRTLRKIKRAHYFRQIVGVFITRDVYKSKGNKIFVVTTPEYGNLGDHAIALAEVAILEEAFPNYSVIGIPDSKFQENYLNLVLRTSNKDMICLIGGGNFGVLYSEIEEIRRKIIGRCKKNAIIMFPQTIDFGSNQNSEKEFIKTKRIYSRHKQLWLMAREDRSYKIMCDNFVENNVLLLPDVVLTWDVEQKKRTANSQSVLLCLRKDAERFISYSLKDEIIRYLQDTGADFFECDTEQYRSIPDQDREAEVERILKIFSEASCVITDRLHGMIFAHICGIPCLAFDNTNKKISGVFKWFKSGTIMCENPMEWKLYFEKLRTYKKFETDTKYMRARFINTLKEIESKVQ